MTDHPTSPKWQYVYSNVFAGREIDGSAVRLDHAAATTYEHLDMGGGEVMSVLDFFSSTRVMLKAIVVSPFLEPTTVPMDRTLGEVLRGFAAAGTGCCLTIHTYSMKYKFSKDEDDWFWVSSMALNTAVRDGYRSEAAYRADQLPGLRSLLTHLLRTGADHVPAGMLDLRAGDWVGTHSFDAGVVLGVDGGRYRVRPDSPVTTITQRTKFGGIIPGKVIHEPMYPMTKPTRVLPEGR